MPEEATKEDLVTALEPFEQPKDVETRLTEALEEFLQLKDIDEDLEKVTDEDLVSLDASHIIRLTYIVSYIRLLRFLRKDNPEETEAQARLGLYFLKHAESAKLQALQMGRSAKDEKLADEVARLRNEVTRIAEYRSKARNGEGDAK